MPGKHAWHFSNFSFAVIESLPVLSGLAAQVDAVLPQTQCTRCGYPDCAHYAQAVSLQQAGVDQCPPGGAEGVRRIAAVMHQAPKALNADYGAEAPRTLAVIDEAWCIGCTLCLDACPTDAILGANKRMHTIVAEHCTGCELCLPVCPVDCIELVHAGDGISTGWADWSAVQADTARSRHAKHQSRYLLAEKQTSDARKTDSSAVSSPSDGSEDAKKSAIALVMAKARTRAASSIG